MVEVKQNSKAALMLKEMLTGYKVKDRFRELHDTYNFKQRNVALRRTIDQDLQHAQEQVGSTPCMRRWPAALHKLDSMR